MKKSILILGLSFLFISGFAQEMKWGTVPKEDLNMTSYAADPDAKAIVLGDIGELYISKTSGDLVFERHRRVKIFDKSAFDRADVSISYYSFEDYEEIENVSAIVYSPNGEKVKVKNKEMFDEQTNKYWSKKKISMPNVKEGSVFEYKYKIRSSSYGKPRSWYFQEDIPIRLSIYNTQLPNWFDYISYTQGRKIDNISSEQYDSSIAFRTSSNTERHTNSEIKARIIENKYVMRNVPALREEAYITTMNDYRSKISFQLKGVQFPYTAYKPIMVTWEEFATKLREDINFGLQIYKKNRVKNIWSDLESKVAGKSLQEKANIIYHFVGNALKWNEINSYYTEGLHKAYQNKEGTSGDINLMFIALLNQAGVDAYPVLVSTRSHGKPLTTYPIRDQFNHVIACLEIDGKFLLADAVDTRLPIGLPRIASINKEGFLIKPNQQEWIDMKPHKSVHSTSVNMKISKDGSIEGTLNTRFNTYQAANAYYLYKNKGETSYIEERVKEDFPDVSVSKVEINKDGLSKGNLSDAITLKIPNYAKTSGDFIYIMPMLNEGYEENPFKSEKREYPIELPYPFKENFIANYEIPDGYIVESLPEAFKVQLPDNSGKFQYLLSQKDNKIQLVMKLNLSKIYYEIHEYETVKKFFDFVVEKQAEQIVLKKAE